MWSCALGALALELELECGTGAAAALPHLSLACLFMGAVTGSGSVREVPAGGLIVGISEAQSHSGAA